MKKTLKVQKDDFTKEIKGNHPENKSWNFNAIVTAQLNLNMSWSLTW